MLRIITPPGSYPITLAEAKAQVRAADSSNDTIIQGFQCRHIHNLLAVFSLELRVSPYKSGLALSTGER